MAQPFALGELYRGKASAFEAASHSNNILTDEELARSPHVRCVPFHDRLPVHDLFNDFWTAFHHSVTSSTEEKFPGYFGSREVSSTIRLTNIHGVKSKEYSNPRHPQFGIRNNFSFPLTLRSTCVFWFGLCDISAIRCAAMDLPARIAVIPIVVPVHRNRSG